MAIDFDSGVGSLFYRLGRVLHVGYILDQYEDTLPAAFTDIQDQYLTSLENVAGALSLQTDGLARVASAVMSFTNGAEGRPNTAWDTIVQTVYNDQPTQSWTRKAAMAEVIRQMRAQSKTVLANVVSCTPTQLTGSIGTGPILVTTLRSDGLVNENIIAEGLRVTCTNDSYTGSATQGQEQFSLVGTPVVGTVWDYDYPTGSSAGVQFNAVSADEDANTAANLLTDGSFEDWSGSPAALTSWTLSTGTWGTSIQQSSDPYTGTYAVQFNAGATLNALSQLFGDSTGTTVSPTALTSYGVNFWIKRDGVVSAGVLTIELVDSTGTVIQDDEGTNNSYTITLSGLTTSYAASNYVFRLPSNPPSVIRLRFRISTALAGANVLIDRAAFAPLTAMYVGGPAFTIFSGAVPFVGGDGWSIVNANDQGGASYCATFQTGFQRLFNMRALGMVLPSSATPNISNTLITV